MIRFLFSVGWYFLKLLFLLVCIVCSIIWLLTL